MLLGEFENIVIESKRLKSDIVYINNDNMYGSDMTFTIIKHTKCRPLPEMIFIVKEWLEFFKLLKSEEVDYMNMIIDIKNWFIMYHGSKYYFYSDYPISKINQKLSTINQYLNNYPICSLSDIKSDDNFSQMMDKNYKTSDGAFMYKVQKYCVSMYKTLLGFTAKDNVSLEIFDLGTMYIMAKYILTTKKDSPVSIYVHYRKS